jgi:hypothetical protein
MRSRHHAYCTLARLLQDPKLGGLDSEDEAAYINLELIGAAADTVSLSDKAVPVFT